MKFRIPHNQLKNIHKSIGCALLICSVAAFGQSDADVHIVPQKKQMDTRSIADTVRPPGVNSPGSAFRTKVDLVLVPVSVNDSLQEPVLTLKQNDFAVFDEHEQQEIRYFSHEDAPVSVALLFDVSKSMTDKIDTERAALREFFKYANPQDEYIGITFSNRPRVLADASESVDEIEQQLTAVQPGGATALLDAVYLAVAELRSARYDRKAIVIISDGGDNASRYTLWEIKKLVQESDVQIYAVGLFETFFFNTLEERLGKKWLREITDATGGHTVTVEDREQLPQATAEISRLIRSQYILGYRAPTAPKSRWRKIKVKVSASSFEHPLHVHYKAGYITGE
jgi:Ca-activated chloride channel family protein